jgi:predicted Zn-ribbon and HTH transcriptional regulator
LFGGAFVPLHKCQSKGHVFCNACKNGDRCPLCTSEQVRWNYDKAFPAD